MKLGKRKTLVKRSQKEPKDLIFKKRSPKTRPGFFFSLNNRLGFNVLLLELSPATRSVAQHLGRGPSALCCMLGAAVAATAGAAA